jgi:hypothetical protein
VVFTVVFTYYSSVRVNLSNLSRKPYVTILYDFVIPHPFPEMSDHTQYAVRDCFFNRRSSVSRDYLLRPKNGSAVTDSALTKYLVKEIEISKPRYPNPRHAQKLLPSTCHSHDLSKSIAIRKSNNLPFSFLSWF